MRGDQLFFGMEEWSTIKAVEYTLEAVCPSVSR